jgi:HPt (histidine-containing phosphotransfer) domain-containing protein
MAAIVQRWPRRATLSPGFKSSLIDRYQRSGMNAAVAKPVRGPELLAAITRLLVSRDQVGEALLLDEPLMRQRVADLGAEQTIRIMRMFPDLAASTASGMRADLANADLADLAGKAHSLAGAAGMLGLQQLFHDAKALESAAKGDEADRCAALLPSVEATLASSQAALAALAERLKPSAPMPSRTPWPAPL